MPELPSSARSRLRARRWDAVVLGGALPGLIAAARLCMAGHRVLVLEEESAARCFEPLREPFLLPGAADDGVLAEVLRGLAIPLIDLRRLEPRPIAHQLVLPDVRIDVGNAARTAEELVTWGLAKPDTIQPVLRALCRAASAERDAMRASPVLRAAGLRRIGRSSPPPLRHARGMPAEAADAPPELTPLFEAQVRVLSNLGAADPGPEARARLLGSTLEDAARFPTSEYTLRGLLRTRIRALHGEFRTLPGGFELVSADGEPGIAPQRSTELWLGRALVLNAPRGLLGRALSDADAPAPELLNAPVPTLRRRAVHLRTRANVIPEGMADRVIWVADLAQPMAGTNVVAIALYPHGAGAGGSASDVVDVIASTVVDETAEEAGDTDDVLERTVRQLMPFSEGRMVLRPYEAPTWDDDAALEDPATGAAWPAELELRLASRPPVYALPRAGMAGLGVEGDALLGWRAGERIAADLG